jgi:hypothetical protein
MKKIILLYLFWIAVGSGFAQLQSRVDERIELSGIVFRLAGAEEYVNNEVVNYAADIDAYFAPYKNHPLIQYVKEIRERDGIAYNAVANTTNLLEIINGQVRLAPSADMKCLLQDPRWTEETFLHYVKLLNEFYKHAKFHTFFNKHKVLYAETEKRFNEFLANIHTEWFNYFFGQSLIEPLIYISLTNGRSNYGGPASCSDDSTSGSITIGCSMVDPDGIPCFDQNYNLLFTIMHEFCHIYTRPIINKYQQQMMQASDTIYPHIKGALAEVAYGDAATMLNESINNLCTNMYFKEYPTGMEQYMIRGNEDYGFIWMRRFVKFMDNFYGNRNIYPYFEDFMPQVVSFINSCGNNIKQIIFEYEHSNPYVVSVFPCVNSIVSADIKEVRVEFSHSMHNSQGIFSCVDPTAIQLNIKGDQFWAEDKKTFIIPVELEKGKKYGFLLPAYVFQAEDRFPMKDNIEIIFQTEE